MRNSKSRSRNKNNRNRQVGNVINRVFDSSGPEGKVRGTPQQIIDKYNQLAQDAHLSNDRVAVENFQQHAEHYLRLLSSAQKEQEARREQQEREQRDRQQQRDDQRQQNQQNRQDNDQQQAAQGSGEQPDVFDPGSNEDSGLVDTPETAPKPKSTRSRKKPAPKAEQPAPSADEGPQEAAE